MTQKTDPLAKMRETFPAHQISKLPKPTKAQTDAVKADFKKGERCKLCGAWHHPDVVHLDYVGHAALTDRMLDADITWSWEPVAFTDLGLPAFDQTGGLWIKLTIGGVTRLGYGHAATKQNADAGSREKEVIGDALRNAAMRFGAALDLWHKGDLHLDDDATEKEAPANETPVIDWTQRGILIDLAKAANVNILTVCKKAEIERIDDLPADKYEAVNKWLCGRIDQLNIDNSTKKEAA